jgi:hypothetical protein
MSGVCVLEYLRAKATPRGSGFRALAASLRSTSSKSAELTNGNRGEDEVGLFLHVVDCGPGVSALLEPWCPDEDLNSHNRFRSADFKSTGHPFLFAESAVPSP